MDRLISVSILLRKSARTPAGLASVKQIATALGMSVTSEGLVSLGCQVPEPRFRSLFGLPPSDVEAAPPSQADFGHPAGLAEMELPIPEVLREIVETISITPPPIRL